jgi:hypothetical protein
MDIDKLREFLHDKKCLINENSTDFICRDIFFCGDHPNKSKQGHLYISKRVEYPLVHCFLCDKRMSLPDFILKVSGNKQLSDSIITKDEVNTIYNNPDKKNKKELRTFQIPKLDPTNFKLKEEYILKRINYKFDINKLPNLIFDFDKFFSDNNIQLKYNDLMFCNVLQNNFIGFLSNNNTKLFCRSINPNLKNIKFRKVNLQEMPYDLLDYYSIPGDSPIDSNLVVLTEGTFNILGEYGHDSLGIKHKVRVYAAGQSFSYSSLLKSLCFFESIFKADVVILSDDDKFEYNYRRFISENEHIINSVKIFYNKNPGGDFGSFPILPYEVKLGDSKAIQSLKWKNNRENKKW